jgi:hypothetical protein
VNELDDGGVQNGALALVAAEPRGHQQNGGPDALAAAVLNVATHFGNERDARLNVTYELALDRLEILTDRLEDVRQVGRR